MSFNFFLSVRSYGITGFRICGFSWKLTFKDFFPGNLSRKFNLIIFIPLCWCIRFHLYRIGIRPDPYCMLCSLHETMDRNHIGRYTALSSMTECERYWEARTKMMENWLFPSLLLFLSLLLIIRTFVPILNVFNVFSLFKCSIYSVTFNIIPLLVA